MDMLIQLAVIGVGGGVVIALNAVGFTMIYGVTGIFHLAHAAVLVVAGYAVVIAVNTFHIPLLIAVAMACAVAAVLGIVIDIIFYRPAEKRSMAAMSIVLISLAIFIVLTNGVLAAAGGAVRGVGGSLATSAVDLFGYRLGTAFVWAAGVLVLASLAGWGILNSTRWGYVLRAVMDDSDRAETIGINVAAVRLTVFAISSALVAVPAAVLVVESGITPASGFEILLLALVAAVIGGMGNVWGAIWGGLAVGLVRSVGSRWVPGEWEMSMVFAFLMAMVVLGRSGFARDRKV